MKQKHSKDVFMLNYGQTPDDPCLLICDVFHKVNGFVLWWFERSFKAKQRRAAGQNRQKLLLRSIAVMLLTDSLVMRYFSAQSS